MEGPSEGQGSCMGGVQEVVGLKAARERQRRCGKGQVEVRHVFFRAGRVHVKGERLGL